MNTRERQGQKVLIKDEMARVGRSIDEFVRKEYVRQGVGIAETAKRLGLDPQSVRAAVGRTRADIQKARLKCSA